MGSRYHRKIENVLVLRILIVLGVVGNLELCLGLGMGLKQDKTILYPVVDMEEDGIVSANSLNQNLMLKSQIFKISGNSYWEE